MIVLRLGQATQREKIINQKLLPTSQEFVCLLDSNLPDTGVISPLWLFEWQAVKVLRVSCVIYVLMFKVSSSEQVLRSGLRYC